MSSWLKDALASNVYKHLGQYRWNSDLDQKKLVRDARIIFDVGANIGQTSSTYRRLFPAADIWAFEPVPETFQQLANRFKNDIKVHPINVALGNCQGRGTIYRGPASITDSMLLRKDRTGKTVDILTDTVDAFCCANSIYNIDILKVDAEGMEAEIFVGAGEMFRKKSIRFVFTEVFFSPAYPGAALFYDLHATLGEHGFELYGLYSLSPDPRGRLHFANALYVLQSGS